MSDKLKVLIADNLAEEGVKILEESGLLRLMQERKHQEKNF